MQKSEYEGFNSFETLTLCHIDTRAVDTKLLNRDEIEFINNYNKRVYNSLSPYLSENEKEYLKNILQNRGKLK